MSIILAEHGTKIFVHGFYICYFLATLCNALWTVCLTTDLDIVSVICGVAMCMLLLICAYICFRHIFDYHYHNDNLSECEQQDISLSLSPLANCFNCRQQNKINLGKDLIRDDSCINESESIGVSLQQFDIMDNKNISQIQEKEQSIRANSNNKIDEWMTPELPLSFLNKQLTKRKSNYLIVLVLNGILYVVTMTLYATCIAISLCIKYRFHVSDTFASNILLIFWIFCLFIYGFLEFITIYNRYLRWNYATYIVFAVYSTGIYMIYVYMYMYICNKINL
ncbi:hypothetical protein RFI_27555 [Reticulomyxa filosa]|uniref:Transmembrane protein n=1 Tax=Reticulomyxa filosa TaxID=46433 RepID=X6M8M3_RETFI|nr:hypothetical protein RFI_27555 [Reticulomyxa filosa]|eukprot:ETO09822.1 hypothetical protein RFI_27555 [Reticulomyxa filosa]